MKILKIIFKNKEIKIPVDISDTAIVSIHDKDCISYLSANTFDKKMQQRLWIDDNSDLGEIIEIELTEVNQSVADPLYALELEKKVWETKLASFIELESSLKERGLL